MVALGLEDCGAAMDPSSGRRVGAEPTKETWLEYGEDPVAVGCGRVVVNGKGGGAGAKAADGGTKCASTRAAACHHVQVRRLQARASVSGRRQTSAESEAAAVVAGRPAEAVCGNPKACCEPALARCSWGDCLTVTCASHGSHPVTSCPTTSPTEPTFRLQHQGHSLFPLQHSSPSAASLSHTSNLHTCELTTTSFPPYMSPQ